MKVGKLQSVGTMGKRGSHVQELWCRSREVVSSPNIQEDTETHLGQSEG